jgi:hypothetical protein
MHTCAEDHLPPDQKETKKSRSVLVHEEEVVVEESWLCSHPAARNLNFSPRLNSGNIRARISKKFTTFTSVYTLYHPSRLTP